MRLLDGLATLSESGAAEIKPAQEDGHSCGLVWTALGLSGRCVITCCPDVVHMTLEVDSKHVNACQLGACWIPVSSTIQIGPSEEASAIPAKNPRPKPALWVPNTGCYLYLILTTRNNQWARLALSL